MMLSQETIRYIQTQIEQTELVNGWTDEHRLEVYQGSYTIFVSYKVLGEFTKEYSYHNEVSFNRYENLHHIDLVDAEILNRVLVILLGHWVLQFCCLGVIVAGRYREREVENAGKSQQDGRKNYDSFVLHCFYNYLNCSRDNVVQR